MGLLACLILNAYISLLKKVCQKYINKVTKRFVADFTYMTIFGMFLMQGKKKSVMQF